MHRGNTPALYLQELGVHVQVQILETKKKGEVCLCMFR
jgi:hypothetical protein